MCLLFTGWKLYFLTSLAILVVSQGQTFYGTAEALRKISRPVTEFSKHCLFLNNFTFCLQKQLSIKPTLSYIILGIPMNSQILMAYRCILPTFD